MSVRGVTGLPHTPRSGSARNTRIYPRDLGSENACMPHAHLIFRVKCITPMTIVRARAELA